MLPAAPQRAVGDGREKARLVTVCYNPIFLLSAALWQPAGPSAAVWSSAPASTKTSCSGWVRCAAAALLPALQGPE